MWEVLDLELFASGVRLSTPLILAGLGGAFLSIAHGSSYVRDISAGRGFIALAALIFGRYSLKLTLLGCMMFGIADAFQIRVQGVIPIPVQFVQMFPYVFGHLKFYFCPCLDEKSGSLVTEILYYLFQCIPISIAY